MFIKTLFPSSVCLGEFTLPDFIDDVLNAGFFGYWFNPEKEFVFPQEAMKALIKTKHIVPMGMELPVDFRNDESTFLYDLARLDEYASYASYIGIRRAATWISPAHNSLSYKKNYELHVSRLRRILDVLLKYDISLGLEFQSPKSLRKGKKFWFIHSLDGLMCLISSLKRPNVGVIMDSWHWDLSSADDFDFNAFENGSQIIAVHINDAPKGLKEDEYKDLSRELPCATGILNIAGFLKGIEKTGYSGPIIVEPFYNKLKEFDEKNILFLVSDSIDKALLEMKRGI